MPKRRVGRYPDEIRRMAVERFRACKNIVACRENSAYIADFYTNGETYLIPLIAMRNIGLPPRPPHLN